jgi:hypothetical protein
LLNVDLFFLFRSGKLKVPEWVDLVKTSKAKELAPYDEDWFYIRCSAIARHMYIRSPIGTNTITKIFGCKNTICAHSLAYQLICCNFLCNSEETQRGNAEPFLPKFWFSREKGAASLGGN